MAINFVYVHVLVYSLTSLLLFHGAASAPSANAAGDNLNGVAPAQIPDDPVEAQRLHLVTFMNQPDKKFAFLQVTAEAQGLYPKVTGYGVDAWWPEGLGAKINAMRCFVFSNVRDNDILVFADAFDVLVYGGRDEVVARFGELERRTNRSIFFNAEQMCFPDIDGVCDVQKYPAAPHRWRFLNSGLIAGRGRALKVMLQSPVPDVIPGGDQLWYQKYFLAHQDTVAVDVACILLCAVWSVADGSGEARLEDGRIVIPETGSKPSFVHFVSVAHWVRWQEEGEQQQQLVATTLLHEIFRHMYPSQAATHLDGLRLGADVGTRSITLFSGPAPWKLFRTIKCIECNFLGSKADECKYFGGLLGVHCRGTCALLVLFPLGVLALAKLLFCSSCPLPWAAADGHASLQQSHAMGGCMRRFLLHLRATSQKNMKGSASTV